MRITRQMIEIGLAEGSIQIVDEAPQCGCDSLCCMIGNNAFYFGGHANDEITAADYLKNTPVKKIVYELYTTLHEDGGLRDEFPDEYEYYREYLKESLLAEEAAFQRKCYEAYQLDWMLSHGFALIDLCKAQHRCIQEMFKSNDFKESSFDGSNLGRSILQGLDILLFEQGLGSGTMFLKTEYLDTDYMKHLLSNMPDRKLMMLKYEYYTGKKLPKEELHVMTPAGEISAYVTDDPGDPGIYMDFTPADYEEKLDIAKASVFINPDYRTKDGETDKDLVIHVWDDPSDDSSIQKSILRRTDIEAAFE